MRRGRERGEIREKVVDHLGHLFRATRHATLRALNRREQRVEERVRQEYAHAVDRRDAHLPL